MIQPSCETLQNTQMPHPMMTLIVTDHCSALEYDNNSSNLSWYPMSTAPNI